MDRDSAFSFRRVARDGAPNAAVAVLLAAMVVLLPGATAPAAAQDGVVTVTSASDSPVGAGGDGVCSAPCTLRAAIEQSNATAGVQRIEFAIGSGSQTIRPERLLPRIDDAVVIDGTTQPGYDGTPLIHIDGGTAAAGFVGPGLEISFRGAGSTIRGLRVTGFAGPGIAINGGGQGADTIPGDNVIEGNWIGVDATGAQAAPNRVGVEVFRAPGNRIGGPSPAQRNVISGNSGNGVTIGIDAGGADNLVEGNYIGTTADGSAPLGNGGNGVHVNAFQVRVIGNVISGNGESGVRLPLGTADDNVVQGNLIGSDATGAVAVGNAGDGVLIDGDDNLIGGTGAEEANAIAFNGGSGIAITRGQRNQLLGNAIHDNDLLGIDLAACCPGEVVPNDAGDADVGPNGHQNFPELDSATAEGGQLTVTGSLDSTDGPFRIELFASPACDPSGNGEGAAFLAATQTGAGPFSITVPPAAGVLTATATDAAGNTSEFSECLFRDAGEIPRIEGDTVRRIAINLCQFLFDGEDGARTVILSRDDVFADALAGSPLAGDDSCVLYTDGGPEASLDPATRSEIDRVLSDGAPVRIMGGESAVSAQAAQELVDAGYTVQRYGGPTRFETAVEIARTVRAENPGVTDALLAYGLNFPDAVTGGAYGAETGTPILLTDATSLHPASAAALHEFGTQRTIVLGGTAVISDEAMDAAPAPLRVSGSNRMATATDVAAQLWHELVSPIETVVVTNIERADGWALTLAAAPLSAREDAPQVGVAVDRYPAETQAYLRSLAPRAQVAFVIGNTDYVDDEVAAAIGADLGM